MQGERKSSSPILLIFSLTHSVGIDLFLALQGMTRQGTGWVSIKPQGSPWVRFLLCVTIFVQEVFGMMKRKEYIDGLRSASTVEDWRPLFKHHIIVVGA